MAQKPPPTAHGTFDASYFDALVAAWHALPTGGPALLLEDSPWAYLTRMAALITPDHRATLRNSLTALRLPTLTFVLHTSSWQVGLRQSGQPPDEYAHVALQQMQALALHMDPCFHLGATPPVPLVVDHVERLLAARVFHVQTAFDGLEHLASPAAPLGPSEARSFAAGLALTRCTFEGARLACLERLARICKLNPAIVNPGLAARHRGVYY